VRRLRRAGVASAAASLGLGAFEGLLRSELGARDGEEVAEEAMDGRTGVGSAPGSLLVVDVAPLRVEIALVLGEAGGRVYGFEGGIVLACGRSRGGTLASIRLEWRRARRRGARPRYRRSRRSSR
jgi:hypothetical protein